MAEAKKKVATKKPATKKKLVSERIIEEKENSNGSIQEDSQNGDQEISRVDETVSAVKTVAKAGKRSAKSLVEAKALEAKQARKAAKVDEDAPSVPKKAQKPARSRLERRGKKFREAAKLIDTTKTYSAAEAVELAIKSSPVKFDATVELHVNLNVDPKQADQNVRDVIALPAGTGKEVRVAVFDDAKVTGADLSGIETITKALEKGELNFDVLIATPAQMPKLGKYARVLGPKGMMPNPKSGTVTADVAKAVKEAKAGRVEYRVDSTGIMHLGIGKVSFGKEKLLENILAVFTSIKGNKPASVKGTYVKSAYVTTAMGPSITTLVE